MAWTTPTTRATGYLVTAANWNTDLVDDLAYLKGQAGAVVIEDSMRSDTDITDDLGSATIRYRNIYGRSVYGNRSRLTPEIRETRLVWEVRDFTIVANTRFTTIQAGAAVASGGAIDNGGSGQTRLKIDNDTAGSYARIFQEVEQSSAQDNAWTVTKNPYLRVEFAASVADGRTRMFFGFRATPGTSIPTATEIHAGLFWNFNDGGTWTGACSGGTAQTTATVTVSAAARHVLEVWINSASAVEIWLDGVRVANLTTNLPTGTLEWEFLLKGEDGGGAADDTNLTLGKAIIQEAL